MSEETAQSQRYNPENLELDELLYYASLALQQGNGADAEWILRHADERFPDDADVQLGLGDVLLARESPEAEAQVRLAAELATDDPLRLTRAGSQMFCIGDLAAARALAFAAAEVLPEAFEYAAALSHLLGQIGEAGEDDEMAEAMLENAYATEPDHEDYGYSLARFLADRGETDRALEIVLQSLIHNPDDEWLVGLREELMAPAPGDVPSA